MMGTLRTGSLTVLQVHCTSSAASRVHAGQSVLFWSCRLPVQMWGVEAAAGSLVAVSRQFKWETHKHPFRLPKQCMCSATYSFTPLHHG